LDPNRPATSLAEINDITLIFNPIQGESAEHAQIRLDIL